jgi:hypothetical protein
MNNIEIKKQKSKEMEESVNQFVLELLLQCLVEKREHVSDIEYKE